MRIGVPKEIKVREKRVGLTAESVRELIRDGHEVLVETNAGEGIGQNDNIYIQSGAQILPDAETVFDASDMIVDGVVHYCVANMPGGVARTSAFALNNATLPFVRRLAAGSLEALRCDAHFCNGLNVHAGSITHEAVARDLGREFVPADEALVSNGGI